MIILDIETTGLDPLKHCMVSLGAVDSVTGDEFYGECRVYPGRVIDPFALGVNGFTEAQCLDETKDLPHALYMRFLQWAVIDTKRDPLIGGQQVGSFDIPFLKAIASDRDQGIVPTWPFGHRSVDLHSVAYAKLGKSLSLDGILQAVGLAPEPKPHNALTGARLERDAFKLLLS
jgi:DNA polymerase-3 subunit epsilon